MSAPRREAVENDSRQRPVSPAALRLPAPLGAGLLAAALLGALLVLVSEFVDILSVTAVTAVVDEAKGHEQHSWAFVPLALVAAFMALGANRGARPAAAALAVLGLAVLAIALLGDLPDATQEGLLAERFESAEASPELGFYLETLGGVLLLVSGVAQLVLGAPGARPLGGSGRGAGSEGT